LQFTREKHKCGLLENQAIRLTEELMKYLLPSANNTTNPSALNNDHDNKEDVEEQEEEEEDKTQTENKGWTNYVPQLARQASQSVSTKFRALFERSQDNQNNQEEDATE